MVITVIVKASKLCNLRCVYCYETPELANKERISHENIEKMFLHLRDYIVKGSTNGRKSLIEFIWHGGEPFAQSISYWNTILELQRKAFPPETNIHYINHIQTNLTLVTRKHLPLLQHFQIGFSYDVINDFRIDVAGKSTANKVRKNADWLLKEGISLGGIAVISRKNIDHPSNVADFFLDRGLHFRALNIYQARDMLPQIQDAALPFEAYLDFFKRLYELPKVRAALDRNISIEPLWTAMKMLNKWKAGYESPLSEAECFHREWALMVNTNGDVYSPGDCYNPEYRYGNMFSHSMEGLLFESEGRRKRIRKSITRMTEICRDCFLFRRGCNGTFVSHATPEDYRDFQRKGGCYHRFLAEFLREQDQTKPAALEGGPPCPPFSSATGGDGLAGRDARPPQEREPTEVLYLNITYRCNSRCLFCAADVAYKKTPRQISLEDVRRLVGDKRFLQIQLSGGEPTIHPDILEIARLCRLYTGNLALLTHGRGFQKKEFAEKILAEGVNALMIPLYGHDAVTHDHVSKVKGSFDQTVKGFENLQELGRNYQFSVELKFLLTRFTAPLNHLIYRFVRERFPHAFQQISICPLIYSKSTLDFKDEFSAPFAEMKDALLSLVEEIRKEGTYRLRLSEFPPCFFPEDLRNLAHPYLNQPVFSYPKFYGDDLSREKVPMHQNTTDFRTTLKGNVLIQCCRQCIHRNYCAERETPYFSSAYLQQFGELEFQPVMEAVPL